MNKQTKTQIMNGCTIRYKPEESILDCTLAGKLIHTTNDEYIIHTPDKNIKAIKFNSSKMIGKCYDEHGEIFNIEVKGFRKWKNPFEINIKFVDKGSNRVSEYSYDIDFYGCVLFQYTNFENDLLNLQINNDTLVTKIHSKNLSIKNNPGFQIDRRNDLNFNNNKTMNIGLKKPIKNFSVENYECNNKINSKLN